MHCVICKSTEHLRTYGDHIVCCACIKEAENAGIPIIWHDDYIETPTLETQKHQQDK